MCPKNFRKYREEKFNRNNKPFTAEFLKVQRKKKKNCFTSGTQRNLSKRKNSV